MVHLKKSSRDHLRSFSFLLPALILFIAFTYYPLVKTILYAFTDWDGFSRTKNFVGIQNFIDFFKDYKTVQAFTNTIYMAVVAIVVGTVLQLGTALMLSQKMKGRGLLKAVYYLPAVISPIILSYTWTQFFQYIGFINQFMDILHIGGTRHDWLMEASMVKNVIVIIQTLQFMGYGMILYLTGLNSIPSDVYEAATIDGAHGFKTFRYITLPLLMPAVTINLFVSLTGALKIFDLPYALTGGGPIGASNTITMEIYSSAFQMNRFGYASAVSLLFFIFIAVITITQLRITKRLEVEY